jgi:REP element-mobilizing transposase RayT
MLDDYGFEIYENNEFPLAYLITLRTYGTWLHGDERSSTRRRRKSATESKLIDINVPLEDKMREAMAQEPLILDQEQRSIVGEAIEEVCQYRNYSLHATNARTNHVHVVLTAQANPDRISDTLKAYATRRLRERGLIDGNAKVWSRGRSRRYLWKPRHVDAAVEYVLYGQGDVPFELAD